MTIPKSINPHRIAENAANFDFELTQEDLNQISTFNQNKRQFGDPEVIDRD